MANVIVWGEDQALRAREEPCSWLIPPPQDAALAHYVSKVFVFCLWSVLQVKVTQSWENGAGRLSEKEESKDT